MKPNSLIHEQHTAPPLTTQSWRLEIQTEISCGSSFGELGFAEALLIKLTFPADVDL